MYIIGIGDDADTDSCDVPVFAYILIHEDGEFRNSITGRERLPNRVTTSEKVSLLTTSENRLAGCKRSMETVCCLPSISNGKTLRVLFATLYKPA
ncbi:hypothetical protein NPIL_539081 [Nephila pilipes]|uniref:Uncharacterized protein n=1 Tax=Nephila pilipes TaxID=299642 RepID=A0A8X6NWQ3_NEPPI|nr:hypothetical protein NPIL_539081 [Nephila pilipes]